MHADWYFDFISPFAYLQLQRFDELPAHVEPRPVPVLFAGLLGHHGHKGPAEIPAKRLQTYRYAQWLAGTRGVALRTPPRHPFNPLGPLRLALSLGATREAVGEIFRFVWGEGNDVEAPDAVETLGARLGIPDAARRVADPEVKGALRANTEAAIARGVYGVPTFAVGGELFWGDDTTGMLVDYLADPNLFERGDMARLADLPYGATRREATPPGART